MDATPRMTTWDRSARGLALLVAASSVPVTLRVTRYVIGTTISPGDELVLWSAFPQANWLFVAVSVLTGFGAAVIAVVGTRANRALTGFVIVYLTLAAYTLAYEWHVFGVLENSFHLF
jgi:hypothetical protein